MSLLAPVAALARPAMPTLDPAHPAFDVRHLGDWLAVSGLRIAIIVLGCLIAVRIGWIVIARVERAAEKRLASGGDVDAVRRARTIGQALRSLVAGLFLFLGAALTLREFGVDVGPLLASAGVVGVAIGFGAQSLVRDVIAGVFVLYENQFDVGDVISGAGVSGVVETVNLRTTVLRDLDGRVHVIPNGEFKVITNLTRDWHGVIVDVGVAYGEDLARVREILEAEMMEMAKDDEVGSLLLEKPAILGVEAFFDLYYTLRLAARVQPRGYRTVKRALQERVVCAFHREGIRMRVPPGAVT